MSEEVKPVVAPTPEVKPVEVTPAVEVKKSSSALPKIIIILVVVLCLCVVCAGAAWVVFTQVLNRASTTINDSLVDTIRDYTLDTGSSDINSETYNFNSTDGSGSFSVGTSLPSNFPSDVPIYSGATASFSATDVNSDGKETSSVTFALKAKVSDVIGFYKSKMGSAGYELKSEVNFFGSVLEYENSKRQVLISTIGSDQEEDIILTITSTVK